MEINKFLTTKQIADEVKVHPNTVRLYEEWGLLRKIPRNKSGYRMFTVSDLNQMKLARLALPGPYPGGGKPIYSLVKEAALFHLDKALSLANEYQNNIIKEEKLAIEAAEILDAWGTDKIIFKTENITGRKNAIRFLDITIDALRTWERNDLVKIKKNEKGQCVYSHENLSRLKIIRILRQAKYSIMSIYRMFKEFDDGRKKDLSKILNTPPEYEEIIHVTDKWLETIREHKVRSKKIIKFLQQMIKNHKK